MSRAPGRRRRAGPGAPVIGAGAGVLTVAALVALQTGLPAASGATALSAHSRSVGAQDAASPTSGPLQIPTIGVVAPGFDDPYLSIAVSLPPTTSVPPDLWPTSMPVDVPSLLASLDPGPLPPDPGPVLADPPVQDPVPPPADPGTPAAQTPDDGTTTPSEPATETPTPTPTPSENPP